MTTNRLYHTVMQQLEQIVPNERITRKRVLAWLMTCLFLGRTPHAARLGNKIPGQAKKSSKAERLRRWLANKAVRVRRWYEPVARQLVCQALASGRPLSLIVDGTRIGSQHQLLMIAIAYRRRALPLAWTWVRCRRGHSSAQKQVALLKYVHSLLPSGQPVQFVGDSEFGAVPVLRLLETWSWRYVLRQKGRYLVSGQQPASWQRFDTCSLKPATLSGSLIIGSPKSMPFKRPYSLFGGRVRSSPGS